MGNTSTGNRAITLSGAKGIGAGTAPRPVGTRPRWHLIYFLLAAFDVITVSASMAINFQLTHIYQESVQFNQTWANYQDDVSTIADLASSTNAPANDVFESRNLTRERSRLQRAVNEVKPNIITLRTRLSDDREHPRVQEIVGGLDSLLVKIDRMVGETEDVFSKYGRGDTDGATVSMAMVDQTYASIITEVGQIQRTMTAVQKDELKKQAEFAAAISKLEVLVGICVVFMVGGALFYGHRIATQIERHRKERDEYVGRLEEADIRTSAILGAAPDAILTFDSRGIIESASPSAGAIFGYDPGKLRGESIDQILAQVEIRPDGPRSIRSLVSSDATISGAREMIGERKDGTRFPAELSLATMEIAGQRMFTGIIRDITRRKQAEIAIRHEESLRRSEERFRSLVQHSLDIIFVLDAGGLVRYASPSVEEVLGYRADEVTGRDPRHTIVHPEDVDAVTSVLNDVIAAPGLTGSVDFRGLHRNGSWRSLEAVFSNLLDTPSVNGIAVNCRDVSERKSFEQQLSHQAFHDALTGLPNRALLLDRVEHALANARRRGNQVGVLFLDLDDFKHINDSLGHSAGDRLLVSVAERLAVSVRDNDTVGRMGGDEFTIVLEDLLDVTEAIQVASRVVSRLERPIVIDNREVFVATSVGIALSGESGDNADDLLRSADVALYQAKSNGKARVQVYHRDMQAKVVERVELESELRRAIGTDQLFVHYQPIVSLGSLEITGFEALLRWQHPSRGMISPATFIPIAEETGLIVPIGTEVLRQACFQTARWQAEIGTARQVYISVNLSPRQLLEPTLLREVQEILIDSKLDPTALVLEITETALLRDTDSVHNQFEELKRLGIRLAIDDFGTGYSALGMLRRFSFDILKVDRSFINGMQREPGGATLVEAMISMARSLGLATVAEGVEEMDQLNELWRVGCQGAQGYLFARPAAPDLIRALLAAEHQPVQSLR